MVDFCLNMYVHIFNTLFISAGRNELFRREYSRFLYKKTFKKLSSDQWNGLAI